MSNLLVHRTRLELGQTAGAKTQVVSADAIQVSRARTINPVPTQGQVVQSLGLFRTLGYSATCPSDSLHDPIFRSMPHRMFYTAERRGKGGGSRPAAEGSGTCTLTLNLPSGAPASWGVGIQTDGEETSATAATTPVVPAAIPSYQEGAVRWFFGNGSDLIDLTDVSQGGSVTCTAQQVQTNRRSGLGVRVASSDVVAKGLSASLSILLEDTASDAYSELLGMESGIFFCARTDADYAYAFPAVIADLSYSAPSTSVATANLTFAQAPGGGAVAGTLRESGTLAVGSGQEGYIVDVTGTDVTRVTANGSVPASGFGVVGSALAIS